MNLPRLLRNKRVLAAAAVAVGVVGVVAVRRAHPGASSTSSSPSSAAPGGGSGGGVGSYDSTATDVASQLGTFGQAQQTALQDFGAQLSTTLAALSNPTMAAPSGTGVGATSSTTPTTPVTPAKPTAHQLTVAHQKHQATAAHQAAVAHQGHLAAVAGRKQPAHPPVKPPKKR